MITCTFLIKNLKMFLLKILQMSFVSFVINISAILTHSWNPSMDHVSILGRLLESNLQVEPYPTLISQPYNFLYIFAILSDSSARDDLYCYYFTK